MMTKTFTAASLALTLLVSAAPASADDEYDTFVRKQALTELVSTYQSSLARMNHELRVANELSPKAAEITRRYYDSANPTARKAAGDEYTALLQQAKKMGASNPHRWRSHDPANHANYLRAAIPQTQKELDGYRASLAKMK